MSADGDLVARAAAHLNAVGFALIPLAEPTPTCGTCWPSARGLTVVAPWREEAQSHGDHLRGGGGVPALRGAAYPRLGRRAPPEGRHALGDRPCQTPPQARQPVWKAYVRCPRHLW